MIKKAFIILLLVLLCSPLAAEYLFLKDGSIIKGSVVRETRAVITFRADEDKKTVRYPRGDVMRILYMEIKMSRVYVQMRTGEVHRVFECRRHR